MCERSIQTFFEIRSRWKVTGYSAGKEQVRGAHIVYFNLKRALLETAFFNSSEVCFVFALLKMLLHYEHIVVWTSYVVVPLLIL